MEGDGGGRIGYFACQACEVLGRHFARAAFDRGAKQATCDMSEVDTFRGERGFLGALVAEGLEGNAGHK